MGLMQNVGWWIADHAYAVWGQVCAFVIRTDPERFRTGDAAPIRIIPGVYDPWRFLLPLIRDLHMHGHPVHVVDPLRNNRVPVSEGARLVDKYLTEHEVENLVIVAHSKGELIGKHVMSFGTNAHRVRAMVAVAAPFGGSRYARFTFTSTLRAFAPRDTTVVQLAREYDANVRIVSVFARYDPHIPEGSTLVGAKNVCVDTGGHFRILAHPDTLAEVHGAADSANPAD